MKFLLDTNVNSEIRKRERAHPNVARWVAATPVKEIGTSVVVLAELRRDIELKRWNDLKQAEALHASKHVEKRFIVEAKSSTCFAVYATTKAALRDVLRRWLRSRLSCGPS